MKILSLFDGISCARVALERAGIHVEAYYASEIDKYAEQTSEKNYPDIIRLGNITNFYIENFSQYRIIRNRDKTGNDQNIYGEVDLLIGGSPCQDLSIAKRDRKGLDGERSGLFWEYVRILKEVKPKYFILENVASMPKEAKTIITEALGVEPIMINASLVSAQNRKRLFWTNIPNVTLPEDRGIFLKDVIETSENIIFTNRHRTQEKWRINKTGKSPTLLSAMGTGGDNVPYVFPVALRNRGEGKKPEYNGTGKANSMTTVQTDSMVEIEKVIRKLTPVECERLQGLPDNYTEGVSNTQRYKCLGNAFNVDVVAHILSFIPNYKV